MSAHEPSWPPQQWAAPMAWQQNIWAQGPPPPMPPPPPPPPPPQSQQSQQNMPMGPPPGMEEYPKKTFRSLSFSHPQKQYPPSTLPGSHLLDTFEEDQEDYELINKLHSASISGAPEGRLLSRVSQPSEQQQPSQQAQPKPPPIVSSSQVQRQRQPSIPGPIGQGSLWFGGGGGIALPGSAGAPGTGSRRHSYAGEALKPVDTKSDIDRYFAVDRLGRNKDYLEPSSPNSPSGGDAAALISVPSQKLYYVQFKANRVDVFYIADNSSLNVKVGDLVIVDADRGRDLGKVVKDRVSPEEAGMLKWKRHQEQQAILQHNPNASGAATSSPGVTMPKPILRFAQPNEVQQIITKESDEDKAVAMCMQKVQEKGLAMSVLDAEYQWDRRKLTFFYSADHRIDFRDLVRDLFRIYKTRIWMCAVTASKSKHSHHHPHHHHPHHQPTAIPTTAAAAEETPIAPGENISPTSSVSQPIGIPPPTEYGLASSQLFGPMSLGRQQQQHHPVAAPPPPPPGQIPQQPPPNAQHHRGRGSIFGDLWREQYQY
ncbi:hypothetical protein TRVA0_055S00760 [Trichomonascus vanleenenianus]|uniref:PSP1 family protein n=1 Tax=Trichomonascus vanleenenianus TaxID=2268995 RepID=UPI003ECB3134